eukprot:1157478-Pelagomonas_calceolata.AAC.1
MFWSAFAASLPVGYSLGQADGLGCMLVMLVIVLAILLATLVAWTRAIISGAKNQAWPEPTHPMGMLNLGLHLLLCLEHFSLRLLVYIPNFAVSRVLRC